MENRLTPLSGIIMEIENEIAESNERILGASFDSRMLRIVDAVSLTAEGHSVDYRIIGKVLDEIEDDYGLLPIEVVEAYNLCDDRQELLTESIVIDEQGWEVDYGQA